MAIRYPDILSLTSEPIDLQWTDRDYILYALGVGYGADPLALAELPYVFETGLKVVPTFASIAAFATGFRFEDTGIDLANVLHGEESLKVYQPLRPGITARAVTRVASVQDKGQGKGALVVLETLLTDAASGAKIAVSRSTSFARADGGFGGPNEPGEKPHKIPDRAPYRQIEVTTRPDQALLYRLSGDRNPIHADPQLAAKVGFPRPLLHGLCTYGIACKVVLAEFAQSNPERIISHRVRFSGPVFPGDTLVFNIWQDENSIAWTAAAKGRDGLVLNNGETRLG